MHSSNVLIVRLLVSKIVELDSVTGFTDSYLRQDFVVVLYLHLLHGSGSHNMRYLL
jgi:hypothetical protein